MVLAHARRVQRRGPLQSCVRPGGAVRVDCPYLAIFAYMITQSRGMAERSSQQAQQARDELRRVVGFSVADEIEKLDRLKKSGAITDQEFARLRAKLVQ